MLKSWNGKVALLLMVIVGSALATEMIGVVIYRCNFDQDDCQFTSNSNKSARISTKLDLEQLTITDRTSITQPANNNETCRIPFKQDDKEYNYCTKENKCETQNGTVAECATGKFLNARSSKLDGVEELHIFSPQIDVTKTGDYEISFYATAYCQSESEEVCKTNADYLAASVDGKRFKEVSLVELAAKKKWEPYTYGFQANSSSFKFAFSNRRYTYEEGHKIYFGIDDIVIKALEPAPTTTTTKATTTTSNSSSEMRRTFVYVSLAVLLAFKFIN